MNEILLLGGGGHAHACIDVIEGSQGYRIKGVVQSKKDGSDPVLGYPIIGRDEDVPKLLQSIPFALVTVGQIKTPIIRMRLYEFLKACGAKLPVIVSPRAYRSTRALVGEGSILMHASVVNAQARVGANCIVNSMALIEHDVVVGNHCHVATGARLNGGVRIGSGTFIGSGAILKEGVEVGEGSIIGAGVTIIQNVPAGTIIRSNV